MTAVALRLGPLADRAAGVSRSGLRWLCSDGHVCRANEIVAYCNLGLAGGGDAFADERYDLQVALAPRVPGRITRVSAASPGAFLDRIPHEPWSPDTVWARFEPLSDGGDGPIDEPNLLFVAGRRFANVAEDRSGLLSGWHDRTRAWWGDGVGPTLLAPSNCEQAGLIRGDDGAYSRMFEASRGPAQIVMTHGEPMVACAAVLRQQLMRTPADVAAIREDVARGFFGGGEPPAPTEWLFMGALLAGVERSLLDERYDLMTRSAIVRAPAAQATCLSLVGESHYMLRHRRLGYVLNMFGYRLEGMGPAVRGWLQREFEPFFRGVDDIARDYRELIAAAPDRAFVFVNRIASYANESIQSYEALDDETLAHLRGLRAQELNLMLQDLARAPNVEVVDADAIAADLGVVQHLPDGVHATAALQDETRAELLRCLRRQGLTGF